MSIRNKPQRTRRLRLLLLTSLTSIRCGSGQPWCLSLGSDMLARNLAISNLG